ncbi:MAG: protein kinase [Myxococcota bacterium]
MGNPDPTGGSKPQDGGRSSRVIPFGKYLLLERIAVGGMAEVFLAKSFGHEGIEKLLAIKRILPTMAEDHDFIEMFIDEAKIAGHLTNANIVPIFELGKIGESHYIAMEYVWGKDMLQIVNRFRRLRKRMPPAMVASIASKLCEGLEYAHNKSDRQGTPLNLVHRDISPQNILVSYEGRVKLIDFGIARAASRTTKTQAGVLKGKFGYMSPEQVRGLRIDLRSDLFALGTCMYEMLTSERLFVGESDFTTLEKVRNAAVAPPSTVVPTPEELDTIVMKALARDPAQRFQSAGELQRALQRFLMNQRPPFTTSKLSSWMKTAFASEMREEKERLDGYAEIGHPSVVGTPLSIPTRTGRRADVATAPAATMTGAPIRPAHSPKNTVDTRHPASTGEAETRGRIIDPFDVTVRASGLDMSDDKTAISSVPFAYDAEPTLHGDLDGEETTIFFSADELDYAPDSTERADYSSKSVIDSPTAALRPFRKSKFPDRDLGHSLELESTELEFLESSDLQFPEAEELDPPTLEDAISPVVEGSPDLEHDRGLARSACPTDRPSALGTLARGPSAPPTSEQVSKGAGSSTDRPKSVSAAKKNSAGPARGLREADLFDNVSIPAPLSAPEPTRPSDFRVTSPQLPSTRGYAATQEVVRVSPPKRSRWHDHQGIFLAAGSLLGVLFLSMLTWIALSSAEPTGSIEIRTVPVVQALVAIDGIARGHTPVRIDGVPAGNRALRIEAQGYQPVRREVQVGEDSMAMLDIVLVALDESGPEPNETPDPDPEVEREPEPVQTDETESITAPESPSPAAGSFSILHINSLPQSEVRVDGALKGRTPLWNLRVQPGAHRVQFRTDDGREHTTSVQVAPRETKPIPYRFPAQ